MGTIKKALFGAGCFWHVEEIFRKMKGVVAVVVGYSGGEMPAPTYEKVCSGETGHAEVAEVSYDPALVSYDTLVHSFFEMHDPTTADRQGPDVGKQYRSAIFYATESEKEIAERIKRELDASGKYAAPIVTEILPVREFYRAEEYHQRYFEKQKKAH